MISMTSALRSSQSLRFCEEEAVGFMVYIVHSFLVCSWRQKIVLASRNVRAVLLKRRVVNQLLRTQQNHAQYLAQPLMHKQAFG